MPSSSSARPSARPRRRTARLVATVGAALAAATLTGACRVDAQVGVQAEPDGSGQVTVTATLDQAAVARLVGEAAGDPAVVDPATRIKLDDLRDAGWTIVGPDETERHGLRVVARHHFDDPAEAARLLAEVGGAPATTPTGTDTGTGTGGATGTGAGDGTAATPAPAIGDVHLRQERTFFKTRTTFAATVDLTKGLGAFTDPDLRTALRATDDAPLGVTAQQLERRFGAPLQQLLGLEVRVRLPGEVTHANGPGGRTTWTPQLGDRAELTAESERWNARNLVALAVALGSAVALAAVLATRTRAGRAAALTVTDGNITLAPDGETGADGSRA